MKNPNPEHLRTFFAIRLRHLYAAQLLLLLYTTLSCHKEPPHPKPGPAIVVDAFSGKPIPFVELVAATNGTGTGWGSKAVASTLSDSTGHFWFPNFMPGGNVNYELHTSKMHYVSGYNTSFDASTYNGDLRVKMKPYGYIRMHVPKPKEEVSAFNIGGSFNPNITFGSPFKDTTYIVSEIGNKMTLVWIWVRYPNGSMRDIKDSIYMPALDTVDYYVKF